MSAADALARLLRALDDAGIPRMLAGSFASSFHGVPRTTHDFDLVIEASPDAIRRLVARLGTDEWYVSEQAALDAVRSGSMFHVIDERTGWKFDPVLRGRDDFSISAWDRRETQEVLGSRLDVATAEDTIVSKLSWAKRCGGSERQLGDVAGIVAVQGARLDRAYVGTWVSRLGLDDLWRRVSA